MAWNDLSALHLTACHRAAWRLVAAQDSADATWAHSVRLNLATIRPRGTTTTTQFLTASVKCVPYADVVGVLVGPVATQRQSVLQKYFSN